MRPVQGGRVCVLGGVRAGRGLPFRATWACSRRESAAWVIHTALSWSSDARESYAWPPTSRFAGPGHSCHLLADETLVETPDLFNDFNVAESQSRPSYSPSPLQGGDVMFTNAGFPYSPRTGRIEAARSEQCGRLTPSRNG